MVGGSGVREGAHRGGVGCGGGEMLMGAIDEEQKRIRVLWRSLLKSWLWPEYRWKVTKVGRQGENSENSEKAERKRAEEGRLYTQWKSGDPVLKLVGR